MVKIGQASHLTEGSPVLYDPSMPDIVDFFQSKSFLGIVLSPAQRTILDTYYNAKGLRTTGYEELILMCGTRGGKTAIGAGIAAYEFLKLLKIQCEYSLSRYFKDTFGIKLGMGQHIYISLVNCLSDSQAESLGYYSFKNLIESSPVFSEFKLLSNRMGTTCGDISVISSSFNSDPGVGRAHYAVIFDEFPSLNHRLPHKEIYKTYFDWVKGTLLFAKCRKVAVLGSPTYIDDCGMQLLTHSSDLYASERNAADIELLSNTTNQIHSRLGFNLTTFEMNPNVSEKDLFISTIKRDNPIAFRRDYLALPFGLAPTKFVKNEGEK